MTLVAESLPPTGADVHQARRLVALLVLVASTGYLCRVDIKRLSINNCNN